MVVCSIFCAGRSVNKSNEMAGKHCVHDDSSYIKWLVCVVYGMVWYGGGLLLCLSGTYGGCVCVCVCVVVVLFFCVK